MSDHPLKGWRFFRVTQTAPGEILIETGGVDTPFGVGPNIGNLIPPLKYDQTDVWKEYMLNIQQRLQAQRASDPAYGDDKVNGVWNADAPSKEYLLTAICGTDPQAFCRQ